jgi:hypothetical protein
LQQHFAITTTAIGMIMIVIIGLTSSSTNNISIFQNTFAISFGNKGSAGFIGTPSISRNSDGTIKVNFKATGLSNIITNVFLSTSSINCHGDNHNNNGVSKEVTIEPQNSNIRGTITLTPPEGCSSPITYDNLVLHLQQKDADVLTYSFGNFNP